MTALALEITWRFALPALLGLTLIGPPATVLATDIKLSNPVDCTLEEDCWIIQYPDVDPGDGWQDFAGFKRSYDTHKGVDIGLSDLAVMRAGVDVIAPADGTVLRLRNDMADQLVTDQATQDAVTDKECGNGMVIDHGEGLQTQLCHLRQGSIRVSAGERVTRGQPLGEIGVSGLTAFPHVHMTVRLDGEVIDPATRLPIGTATELSARDAAQMDTLWASDDLAAYNPVDIVQIGFGTGATSIEQVIEGNQGVTSLGPTPPALVLWTALYGVRAGDELRLQILNPTGGSFFDQTKILEADKIRWFQFSGRRVREPLQVGIYTGRVTITRGDGADKITERRQTIVEILD